MADTIKKSSDAFIFLLIAGFLFLVLSTAVFYFGQQPREIKKGFSESLLTVLDTQYDIHIPSSAQFMEGSVQHSFRDPFMRITYSIAMEDRNTAVGSNWKDYPNVSINDFEVDSSMYRLDPKGQIYFSEPLDERITVLLITDIPANANKIK